MRLEYASCNWTSPSVSILTRKTATQAVSFSLIASQTTLLEPECCDSRYDARTTLNSNTQTSTRAHELRRNDRNRAYCGLPVCSRQGNPRSAIWLKSNRVVCATTRK